MGVAAAGDEVAQHLGADMAVRVGRAVGRHAVAQPAGRARKRRGEELFLGGGGAAEVVVDVGAGADEGHGVLCRVSATLPRGGGLEKRDCGRPEAMRVPQTRCPAAVFWRARTGRGVCIRGDPV
jgi:hypothetical protein